MALGQALERMVGDKAPQFNAIWRDKQLEYSFRKAVMKQFNHFTECTQQALEYCDMLLKTRLSSDQKSELLEMYRKLPAYDETEPCLANLKKEDVEIIAFSNGKGDDLTSLFKHAGIFNYFNQIISVDEVGTFKPSPEVYELLVKKSTSIKDNTWLVSGNAFDIIGASTIGLKTIWLKRNPDMVFDPFGIPYTLTVGSLMEIAENNF